MKIQEMNKIINHFDKYFEQSDSMVLHPIIDKGFHIDVLLYKPNERFPFWKLVTMGASDYKMPTTKNAFSEYNEYIMLVNANEDLSDQKLLSWYYTKLILVASFSRLNQCHITYGHSLEWKNDDPEDEMIGAFIELPEVFEKIDILYCKTGFFKTVTCLQVVLLNKNDIDKLMKIGPQAFSEHLCSGDGGKQHFLSEKRRSDNF